MTANVNISTTAPTGVTISITDIAGHTSASVTAPYVDPANPVTLALPDVSAIVAVSSPYWTNTPGVEFTTTSWHNQRLPAAAPIDPNSTVIVNNLVAAIRAASPNGVFAVPDMPLYRVSASQPTVPVKVIDGSNPTNPAPQIVQLNQQFQAGVPMPDPNTFIPQDGTDREALIYQPDTHRLWEGAIWYQTGAQVRNSAGALVPEWATNYAGYNSDLRTATGDWTPQPPSLVPPTTPGVAGSGINYWATTPTIGELRAGLIEHVIGCVIPQTATACCRIVNPPAWRTDGQNFVDPIPVPPFIPYGAILRLPANVNLDAYPQLQISGGIKPVWRVLAECIRDYGMVIQDQGGGFVIILEKGATPQYPSGSPYETDIVLQAIMGPLQFGYYANTFLGVSNADFPWDQLQLILMPVLTGYP